MRSFWAWLAPNPGAAATLHRVPELGQLTMNDHWQGAPIAEPPTARSQRYRHGLALIWGAALLTFVVLSLIPQAAPPPKIDKGLHALSFAFLTILSFVAFRRTTALLAALGCVLVVGLASEALQSLVPGRTGSLEDVAANLIGMAIGIVVGLLMVRLIRRVKS
jgi:VanZ family protein